MFIEQAAAAVVGAAVASQVARADKANSPLRPPARPQRIPNTDLEVSGLAFGLATIAEWNRAPLSSEAIATAEELIHTAYHNGIRFFDMADQYAFGKVEAAFGEVLRRSPGLRNQIVIQSKCGVRFEHATQLKSVYHVDCSAKNIVSAAEGSLQRLGIDHLDVLLLHWPDALVRPDEVARAFDTLKDSGKVRYFGVSNHTVAQISLLKKSVRQPLVANQIRLGLLSSRLIAGGLTALWGERNENTELAATLDYCRLHEMQIQAYAPLRGLLRALQTDAQPPTKELAQALAGLAESKRSTPVAIALAWLLHLPAGIVPVFSSSDPEHLTENCSAASVALTDEEWYTLLIAASRVPVPT